MTVKTILHAPPAATYYSLDEKIDGNVMTIKFSPK